MAASAVTLGLGHRADLPRWRALRSVVRAEHRKRSTGGVVSVEDAEWRRPEFGYWLVPEVHGE